MSLSRRSAGWSAALLGLSAVTLALVRRQRPGSRTRSLENKVMLVTGGSRGLGFAIATELASQGARLVLTARDPAELEQARQRLTGTGFAAPENVFVQAADVTRPDEVKALVRAATDHFGRIDVLVNNAGVILVGPVENQTIESFHKAMDTNFYGALHTTLAVLPQMLQRGDGAIVNIASIGGKVAFPHLLPYVASKFAMVGWSQGLRAELASKGVAVVTVNPGVMRTGSHIQARYTGNTQAEYRWFAAAASSPLTATDAARAARKVVRALIHNSAEVFIGLQAIAAGRLAGIAPEVTAAFLATANRLLPNAAATATPGGFWEDDHSVPGKVHHGSLPAFLERSGNRAIQEYAQDVPQSTLGEEPPISSAAG